MQWLIDLVIEAIGIPPVYIDRGDPAADDFVKADFIADGNWYEEDLSAIVPEGAKAVVLRVDLRSDAVGKWIQMRKPGNVNTKNVSMARTQIANLYITNDMICSISEDRKIEWRIQAALWINVEIVVKGWIL